MQFLSSRSVAFSIMLVGQRMAVMFSERNENGQCSFITHRKDVAEAIRRHSFFKKGIIWEDARDSAREPLNTNEGAAETPLATGGAQTQPLTAVNAKGAASEGGDAEIPMHEGAATEGGDAGTPTDKAGDGKQDEVKSFGNFSEAKEWFCKTHNVAKTSVKNPTALMAAAEALGVKIAIG